MTGAIAAGRERPLTLLIAALGGEGGGLLADWIVEAATHEGVLVQSTSIPGVAQRTGATTYYIEMMRPQPGAEREPVFGLYPAPGHVDLMVASELVEAGRALENGFVTPDRTTLIAATHRVFAMEEKTAMAEGAFEPSRILRAAEDLAADCLLRDFRALSLSTGAALNALLLGAIAATGLCPLSAEAFEVAIRSRGVAVEANLAGFRRGLAFLREENSVDPSAGAGPEPASSAVLPVHLEQRVLASLPAEVAAVAIHGAARLRDYQDEAYAELYLNRLDAVLAAERGASGGRQGHGLTRETARWLALWMAYEDVMRVAQLKSRASRYSRIRKETAARADEPIQVREFLKPGVEELATVLPRRWGERLTGWAERRGLKDRLHLSLRVRSDTISGYLRLRLIAALKRRRRHGLRYAQEQALIERWLDAIERCAAADMAAARQIAECGRLIKGYSDTRARAIANFSLIFAAYVQPVLAGRAAPDAAARIAAARAAALGDEEGVALRRLIAEEAQQPPVREEAAVRAAR